MIWKEWERTYKPLSKSLCWGDRHWRGYDKSVAFNVLRTQIHTHAHEKSSRKIARVWCLLLVRFCLETRSLLGCLRDNAKNKKSNGIYAASFLRSFFFLLFSRNSSIFRLYMGNSIKCWPNEWWESFAYFTVVWSWSHWRLTTSLYIND